MTIRVISVLSPKGGVGKTTIATALAVESYLRGIGTVLIDGDPTANALEWSQFRTENDDDIGPFTVDRSASGVKPFLIEAEKEGVEIAVIDTPGKTGESPLNFAKLSDFIVIPTGTSPHDIGRLPDAIDVAKLSQKPFLVVINGVPRGSVSRFYEAKKAIQDSLGVPVYQEPLSRLFIHQDSADTGQVAAETEPKGRGAREFRNLFSYIHNMLTS